MPTMDAMKTSILAIDPTKLGTITLRPSSNRLAEEWSLQSTPEQQQGEDMQRLLRAARELRETNTPVAFPTETVYGLGADATRSEAVRAIFKAKGRPSDNPLIVHVDGIEMLGDILRGGTAIREGEGNGKEEEQSIEDLIPAIYHPLIQRFWPGPLTIILPLPSQEPSSSASHPLKLAPEVTSTLPTFGARMPRSLLALLLIRLAGVPLAAPSANASTRPSPTAAEHVHDDLATRITTIIDGGPCEVGVESTVVDGLSEPPCILRPGGISVDELRTCPGWENVQVAYKDKALESGEAPRAPGMKYRHYSPRAPVVLQEAGSGMAREDLMRKVGGYKSVGVTRTRSWEEGLGLKILSRESSQREANGHAAGPVAAPSQVVVNGGASESAHSNSRSNLLKSFVQHQIPHASHLVAQSPDSDATVDIWDIDLGAETEGVARGLFSALRELDKKGVEVIFVEGIDDKAGDDIAAAVMNRLRKAAEVQI